METRLAICRGKIIRYRIIMTAGNYCIAVACGGEQAAIENLTPRREEIEALAVKLRKGRVTPVALRDVVEDWLLR